MSLFSQNESYLGVDIGSGGIKLVELKKSKGRPQLWTYGILEEPLDIHLPEIHEKTVEELSKEKELTGQKIKKEEMLPHIDDPRVDRYAKLLKHLMKEARVVSKNATASLPVSYVFQAVVNLPIIEEKEIRHIIMAEISKMISRPIEEMQVVYQRIPEVVEDKKNKFWRFLVTVAPRELVAFYTAIFQKAGLQLKELETSAFALERSLVGKDKTIAMVIDMGAQRTDFFIMEQGLPVTQRSISVGGESFDKIIQNILGCETSELAEIKKDLTKYSGQLPLDLFLPILDPIIKEIEYSFDLFLHQTGNEGKRPEKIIFTGGSALFPFVVNEVADKFPMKVFLGDPWARVIYHDKLKIILDSIGPRMSVAIGLAMRKIL